MWETYILTGIFIEDSACCGHVLLLAGIPLDTANRAICHRERVDKALPASAKDRKYAHTPASAGVNGPWSVPTAFASNILCHLGLELIPITWGSARGKKSIVSVPLWQDGLAVTGTGEAGVGARSPGLGLKPDACQGPGL